MAMTKEQQKAAADRIMAKNPLTEEERQWMEFRDRKPEEYVKPDEVRVCGICQMEFKDVKVDGQEIRALEQFADHVQEHYPTAAQWSEAYTKIQQAKAKHSTDTQ